MSSVLSPEPSETAFGPGNSYLRNSSPQKSKTHIFPLVCLLLIMMELDDTLLVVLKVPKNIFEKLNIDIALLYSTINQCNSW